MSIWQPIETAPLDGTYIDLWDGYMNCRVTDAAWQHHNYRDGKPNSPKSWGIDSRDWAFCVKPTHWMPRPKPPEEKK